jgi:hypothetical protein
MKNEKIYVTCIYMSGTVKILLLMIYVRNKNTIDSLLGKLIVFKPGNENSW